MHSASLLSMMLQDDMPSEGLLAAFLGVWLIVVLVFVLFYGFCLMKIAQKTNTENGWLGFIPILNVLLMVNIARKPWWWFLVILFVPIANIVLGIIVWIEICKARGKSPWILLLFLVPIVNLLVLPYLAFSD